MYLFRRTIAMLCATCLLFSMVAAPAFAASGPDIEASITAGVAYLASTQNADGSWGDWEDTAFTGLVLVKLQDRAFELGFDPFDPAYQYSGNVEAAWEFVLSNSETMPITPQDHTAGATGTMDDPDSNGNGEGLFFFGTGSGRHHSNYTTGIVLLALCSSRDQNRSASAYGYPEAVTFGDLSQDVADWLAFGQGDTGNDEGGWGYEDIDNGDLDWTDNSGSGYVTLGLAAAKACGVIVPDWVTTELNVWINTIQDPVDGDPNDGGSYYNPDWIDGDPWCNELKTGNLIFQMTFVGDSALAPRFQDAMDYIERHWDDPDPDPGWGPSGSYAPNYQAMFCLMKGFNYSEITAIDLDGDGVNEHDWYAEFSDKLVADQNADGSWSGDIWGDATLSTCWALLTLEGIGFLDGGMTVESDCFTEQIVEIPVQMSFTIGHKLKVHVNTTNIVLGEKLLPGDEGDGELTLMVWSNDDVECRIISSDFIGDDEGVNDEEADTVTCPDGLVADDWDTDARYDEDEGMPHVISGDRLSVMICGVPYTQGSWFTVNNGPTGDDGVECEVGLVLGPITYSDHAGYYTGTLTLDVRQF